MPAQRMPAFTVRAAGQGEPSAKDKEKTDKILKGAVFSSLPAFYCILASFYLCSLARPCELFISECCSHHNTDTCVQQDIVLYLVSRGRAHNLAI